MMKYVGFSLSLQNPVCLNISFFQTVNSEQLVCCVFVLVSGCLYLCEWYHDWQRACFTLKLKSYPSRSVHGVNYVSVSSCLVFFCLASKSRCLNKGNGFGRRPLFPSSSSALRLFVVRTCLVLYNLFRSSVDVWKMSSNIHVMCTVWIFWNLNNFELNVVEKYDLAQSAPATTSQIVYFTRRTSC